MDEQYLAGLLDGEGCISINEDHPKRTSNPVFSLEVIISSTDLSVIEYYRRTVDAGYIVAQPPSAPNHRTVYHWKMRSRQAATFLRSVYDHLRLKRGQVDIALKFMDTFDRRNWPSGGPGSGRGSNKTPSDVLYLRQRYKEELTRMKGYKTKRGRPKARYSE